MKNIDIQSLSIFLEIYKTRSVGKAALACGLSQPSISLGLSRLRKHYNDPLFIRLNGGMDPTPLANELAPRIQGILEQLEQTLGLEDSFDPATSNKSFRICVTDVSQTVAMPALMNVLKSAAPGLRICLVNATSNTSTLMSSGEVDMSIGFLPSLDADFRQSRLFDEDFVCISSAAHPRIRGSLTLAHFSLEDHLVVTTSGTGHWIVSKTLDAKRIHRKVALEVESFLGIGAIISQTALIATVPRRFGEHLAQTHDLKIYPPPIPLPPYSVKQYWHERVDNDLSNKWLRETIQNLFSA